MKVLLSGSAGRMGRSITSIAEENGFVIAYPVDQDDDPAEGVLNCDVAIDFSLHHVTLPLARLCADARKPMVIGTTGHDQQTRSQIEALATKIPMVWAGNFSTGVNLLYYLTEQAARVLDSTSGFDAELIEMHHRLKKDSPSGTAERLLDILKSSRRLSEEDVAHGRSGFLGERPIGQIGSHSLRGGDVVGDHTVIFAGSGERLELTHRATDRRIFATGALKAAKWAVGRKPGLYSMQDVLGLSSD